MQVQTLGKTLFNILIWGNLDFLQKSFITSTTGPKKTLAKNPPDQTLAEYQNHKFMKMDFQKRMQSKVESEIKAMNKWHPN